METTKTKPPAADKTEAKPSVPAVPVQPEGEIGGPQGAEPTRFGDWEVNGRCSDF